MPLQQALHIAFFIVDLFILDLIGLFRGIGGVVLVDGVGLSWFLQFAGAFPFPPVGRCEYPTLPR